jgi:hypothetical protein
MKNARYLSMTALGILFFARASNADPVVSDAADNPYTQVDPDGIPLNVAHPLDKPLTPDEMSALHKAQEKAALDKDWLVRNYERQLQAHAAKSGANSTSNLYYQLSTNKELAKLAGISVIDMGEQEGTVPVPHSTADAQKLRPNDSSALLLNSAFSSDLLKPLITPFSASDASAQHSGDDSSLLPDATPSVLSDHPQITAPSADDSSDPADIETPGMIAAEKDPLANPTPTDPDLSLDLLPGETPEQAKEREDNNTKLELPLPMDETQLHRQQTATLSVPGTPSITQTSAATTTTVKTTPLEDPEAPIPISKEPQINPVRPAIANPFDILHR